MNLKQKTKVLILGFEKARIKTKNFNDFTKIP